MGLEFRSWIVERGSGRVVVERGGWSLVGLGGWMVEPRAWIGESGGRT